MTSGDLEEEYRRICQRVVPVRTYSIDRSAHPNVTLRFSRFAMGGARWAP